MTQATDEAPNVSNEGVSKHYGKVKAVDYVSLAIPRNAFYSL